MADATESAYAHLYTLRNWEAVRPWLMRITVNACHKMLRRRKRETPSGDEALFDRPIKPSDATEIWSLVEQLDALYSVPLTMFYADGMKLEEIAAALHVPKGTVSARMTRGAAEAQDVDGGRTMTEREIEARLRNERISLRMDSKRGRRRPYAA